ncbi:MAG TPA: molybdenum cofactor biosynthesis protein MoaE, partial [Pyrinomonadaceae bacterium]|nr:molybdenum cofactor biosynthesis protein MoaE [Pyrinomonadaceae bacterium]
MDFYELTNEPLNIGEIARRVVPANCGAIVTLDGFVRQWTKGKETIYLEYEAYEPMALKEMEKLIKQAHGQFEIENVGI